MARILVCNDDGVYAKGIHELAQHLSTIAEVQIIAPDRNRSGASNSLTLNAPIRLKHLDNGAISVEGTPTDCVHVAITGLMSELPDMVVSGINAGANLGDDVWYSGTVAGAIEGRFCGRPSIAISLMGDACVHYETAAKVAVRLVQQVMQGSLPNFTILNVNVPDVPYEDLRGFEITRLGTRHRAEPTIQQTDPRGQPIYWIGPAGPEQDAGPGTDFHAVKNNAVSITPLQLDITHYSMFDQLSEWVKAL